MLGPHWGLIIFIGFLVLISAIAIEFAIVTLGKTLEVEISRIWSGVAVAAYLGSPVLLNELQAGHLKFIESFAILPAICALALQRWTLRRAIIIGGLIGVCAAQPQFFGLAILSILAFSITGRSFEFRFIATAVIVALLLNSPQLTSFFIRHAASGLSSYRPLLRFEVVESANLLDAIRSLGYMAGYDSRLIPAFVMELFWLFPALAFVSLIYYFRRLWPIAALMVVGILTCSAWKTILAPLWTFLFTHIAALAAYRELYDVSAITWLGYCTLAPIALQTLVKRFRIAIGGGALLLAASSCLVAARSMQGLPIYMPTPAELSALRQIDRAPGTFRFLTVPSIAPAGLAQFPQKAGYSPWFLSLATHPTAFAAIPNYVSFFIGSSAIRSHLPTKILHYINVGEVFTSTGWSFHAKAAVEPRVAAKLTGMLPSYVSPATRIIRLRSTGVAVLPYSVSPGSLENLRRDGSNISIVSHYTNVNENRFSGSTDPANSWARTPDAPYLPPWAYALPLDYFTTRAHLMLPVSAKILLAGDADGKLTISGCRKSKRIDAHFYLFRCNPRKPEVFHGAPPIVLSQALSAGTILTPEPVTGSIGNAKMVHSSPWGQKLWVRASAGSVLVLRQSYDPGWSISVPNVSHVRIDGYANGWVFEKSFRGYISVFYSPATMYYIALCVSLISFVVVLLISLAYSREAYH